MSQAELHVFVGDLQDAAKAFFSTSEEFGSHMPKGGFSRPSSGDPDLDQMMGVALQTIGEMHHILAQAIAQHGEKIDIAADRYAHMQENTLTTVESVNGILQDMTTSKYVPPKDFRSPIPD